MRVVDASLQSAALKSPFRYWTTRELEILREHFPQGGVEVCRDRLPHRSFASIYHQARIVQRLPTKVRDFSGKRWPTSAAIDAAIRAIFTAAPRKGAINEFAFAIMRPRWWVSKRAATLGLVMPRTKDPNWSEAEIELLNTFSHHGLSTIRRKLAARGFRRSTTAIAVKRKRLHLAIRDPQRYTANQLAGLLGVDCKTITRWIEHDGLPAGRRGTARTPQQGGDMHWIERKALRGWIASHGQLIDLRKVDRFWFIELAFGKA